MVHSHWTNAQGAVIHIALSFAKQVSVERQVERQADHQRALIAIDADELQSIAPVELNAGE